MFGRLKNHPFAVEAHFKQSVVVTYAVKIEELRPLIPSFLELDTFQDTWGFVAIAMVQTEKLRPRGFPQFFGSDFFLIGYRVFVRYTDLQGKRKRGLYILKSETDSPRMTLFGNIFTHYNYTTTDIQMDTREEGTRLWSNTSRFDLTFSAKTEGIALPNGSVFAEWKEARRFAGPLPFTFTYNAAQNEVLIIEGVRQNWTPNPLHIVDCKFPFLDEFNLSSKQLSNAFVIEQIPYWWKKGRLEKLGL